MVSLQLWSLSEGHITPGLIHPNLVPALVFFKILVLQLCYCHILLIIFPYNNYTLQLCIVKYGNASIDI